MRHSAHCGGVAVEIAGAGDVGADDRDLPDAGVAECGHGGLRDEGARACLDKAAVFVQHEDGVTGAGEQRFQQRVSRLSPEAG